MLLFRELNIFMATVFRQAYFSNFPVSNDNFANFFIGFDYLRASFGGFLTFCRNHKIQEGGSKMAAVRE